MQPISTRRVSISVNDEPGAGGAREPELLLVTEDTDFRAAAARALERKGYRIHTAAHSGHALLVCLSSRIDLLITELSTPYLSGPALTERLRRHQPVLTALYLAHPGTPEGLDNVIVRPFTRDDLIARIEGVLAPTYDQ